MSTKRGGKRVKARRGKKKPSAAELFKRRDTSSSDYESDESEDYSNSDDEGRGAYRKGGYHPARPGDRYKEGR